MRRRAIGRRSGPDRPGETRAARTLPVICLTLVARVALSAGPLSAQEPPLPPARPGAVVVELEGAGRPIEGARVTLRVPRPIRGEGEPDLRRKEAFTWAVEELGDGRYLNRAVAAGRYLLDIEAAGYSRLEKIVRVASGEWVRVRLTLQPRPFVVRELVATVDRGGWVWMPGRAAQRLDFTHAEQELSTLADWLRGLPGVGVREYGAGGRQVVSLRGSRPSGVLVLLDGVPVNDPVSGEADLSGIPGSTLESATVIPGAGAEYGSGALGGVLLLRSRQPEGRMWRGGIEKGSFGRRAADVFLSSKGSAGVLSLSGRLEDSDNDFTFRDRVTPGRPREVRKNADAHGWNVALSGSPRRLPLSGRFRISRVERGSPGRMGTDLFDRARWSDRGVQASVRYGTGSSREWSGAFRSRWLRYRDPASGTDQRQRAADLRLRGTMRWNGAWRASFRAERETVSGDGLRKAPARLSAGITVSRTFGGPQFEIRPSLTLDFGPGERSWSPGLVLTGRPASGWTLWGRIGQAFRFPTFSDLYFAAAYGVRPNPDLRAEKVRRDAELGAEWEAENGSLQARVSFYSRRTANPIVWLASSVAIWSPRNLERLNARGLEWEARWRPARGWRIGLAGSASRSRIPSEATQRSLPYQPGHRARVNLARRVGSRVFTAEWALTGARTTTLAGTHHLPAFSLVDVSATQEMNLGDLPLRAELRIRNLLDRRYEVIALFPEPGRRLEMRLSFAAPERTHRGERASPRATPGSSLTRDRRPR